MRCDFLANGWPGGNGHPIGQTKVWFQPYPTAMGHLAMSLPFAYGKPRAVE